MTMEMYQLLVILSDLHLKAEALIFLYQNIISIKSIKNQDDLYQEKTSLPLEIRRK
jgi:hypothetical protein